MLAYIKAGIAALLIVLLSALASHAMLHQELVLPGAATEARQIQPQPAPPMQTTAIAASPTQPVKAAQPAVPTSTPARAAGGGDIPVTQAGEPTTGAQTVVKQVGPAVVTIVNTQQGLNGRRRLNGLSTAIGSGVIIDLRGYILTNNHVIANQQSLQVIFSDGRQAPASIVGTDASADIAVIKVSGSVPAVAQFGDSNALEPGQPVIAIGSALGDFRNTVTAGVVSALHRDLSDNGQVVLKDLIQTDAAINEGNSGGPLISMDGRVIGINTATVRSDGTGFGADVAEGLGFAIPSNTASQIANRLIKNSGSP